MWNNEMRTEGHDEEDNSLAFNIPRERENIQLAFLTSNVPSNE